MYADGIVSIMATSLQEKLHKLHKFCCDWCLEMNVTKNKVLVFNKAGRLLKDKFHFDEDCLENVRH